MRKLLFVIQITLLLPALAEAGPKNLVHRVSHEMKKSFVDIKRHPFQWGIYAVATIGLNYTDTASSCVSAGSPGSYEANPAARLFIGRHPSCHKLVTLTSVVTPIQLASFHALSNKFYEHCQAEARDPQSIFNTVEAANHSPEPCHYMIQYAALGADLPWRIEIIHHNLSLEKP